MQEVIKRKPLPECITQEKAFYPRFIWGLPDSIKKYVNKNWMLEGICERSEKPEDTQKLIEATADIYLKYTYRAVSEEQLEAFYADLKNKLKAEKRNAFSIESIIRTTQDIVDDVFEYKVSFTFNSLELFEKTNRPSPEKKEPRVINREWLINKVLGRKNVSSANPGRSNSITPEVIIPFQGPLNKRTTRKLDEKTKTAIMGAIQQHCVVAIEKFTSKTELLSGNADHNALEKLLKNAAIVYTRYRLNIKTGEQGVSRETTLQDVLSEQKILINAYGKEFGTQFMGAAVGIVDQVIRKGRGMGQEGAAMG